MSIASNITALVSALASAINARGQVGPSDYQMWLAQGNTGTLADYRTAMVGPDEDFAAYFNSQLGPYPTSGTASTTQAGITQLATTAETTAGAIATKVVTPAGLLAVQAQYQVNSVAALWALRTKPEGTLVSLMTFATTNGSHIRSIWSIGSDGSTIHPATPIVTSNYAALGDLYTLLTNTTATGFALSYYGTEGIVQGTSIYDRRYLLATDNTWVPRQPQPLTATTGGTFGATSGFARIPFTLPTGRTSEWDSTAQGYKCPRTGWYQVKTFVRVPDGTTAGWNIGISAGTLGNENNDRNFMTWQSIPGIGNGASANRYSTMSVRSIYATKNSTLIGDIYVDGGGATINFAAGAAQLDVIPMGL